MSQSLAFLGLHVVFSTKDRKQWLDAPQLGDNLHAYIAGTLRGQNSPAVVVGGTADHVHFLCNLSRTISVADLVRVTKRAATLWVREQAPEYRAFQWQGGYGAFAVSASSIVRVREYIIGQRVHHAKMDFKNEFRRLLKKHGIEYDERYVWD